MSLIECINDAVRIIIFLSCFMCFFCLVGLGIFSWALPRFWKLFSPFISFICVVFAIYIISNLDKISYELIKFTPIQAENN